MTTITCKFCNSTIDAEAPTLGSILMEPGYEPAFFGEDDFAPCDECGRIVCMACAIFDFTQVDGPAMRYLCPDCGEPVDTMMQRIGAPMLPLEFIY